MTNTNRVIIHADFDTNTGYGNLATDLAINLEKSGAFDVYTIGTVGFGLPSDLTRIFEKPKPPKFEIYFRIGAPAQLRPPESLKAGFPFKKVALTMWEQTRLSKEFISEDYFNFYDTIFVPCEMNVGAFREVFDGLIKVMPLGVDTDFYQPIKREFLNPLKICMLGNLTYRKNVMGAVRAVIGAREQGYDVVLNLKSSTNTFPPEIVGNTDFINVVSTVMWTKRDVRDFYYNNDIYLAISRGEGFNMPALEFLATGGVVIGHDWGGHKSWFNELYCTKVLSYEKIKVSPNVWRGVSENSYWAETNIDSVVSGIIDVCKQKRILYDKSNNAIKFIDQIFSWRSQLKHIITLLEEV